MHQMALTGTFFIFLVIRTCQNMVWKAFLLFGEIDEKVPQQRENQILAESGKSGKLMKKCHNSEKTKLGRILEHRRNQKL